MIKEEFVEMQHAIFRLVSRVLSSGSFFFPCKLILISRADRFLYFIDSRYLFSVHNLVIQEMFGIFIENLVSTLVTDNTLVGLVLEFQSVQILFTLNHQEQRLKSNIFY